jgi:hypothetical protein
MEFVTENDENGIITPGSKFFNFKDHLDKKATLRKINFHSKDACHNKRKQMRKSPTKSLKSYTISHSSPSPTKTKRSGGQSNNSNNRMKAPDIL